MGSKTRQLSYWQGEFGDAYTIRNANLRLFRKRKPFFKKLLKNKDIKSILEIGCNIGGNLLVLKEIKSQLELWGIEPNAKAIEIARKFLPKAHIYQKNVFDMTWRNKFDLVFTSGVLIHVADKDLAKALRKIFNASKRFILTIEYYSTTHQTIPYRGLSDALFKRPYDQEWLTRFSKLQLIDSGFLDKAFGFDDCHWWLFHK